ncbi:MAG: peptidase M6 [Deltaproteobacteria bacterium]|nr:peptidase M6 [Deltaproteobacteria bacterium]
MLKHRSRTLLDPRFALALACLGSSSWISCALVAADDGAASQGAVRLPPLDPQHVRDQDEMDWTDYRAVPGVDWADPSLVPLVRTIHVALIAADFDDQPFVLTLPKKSDRFGNPQVDPVGRAKVPAFYAEYWNGRSALHHGHTVNEYWMEQSHGRVGLVFDAFGPYRMPKHLYQYGLHEFGQESAGPSGVSIDGELAQDCDGLWRADAGPAIAASYDQVIRIFAGYDETGVWQEFGEMKFQTRDDIPAEWGSPDPTMPRWAPTRFAPWTSWKAASMPWSSSAIIASESSGSIAHELAHAAFFVVNNYNNPFAQPYRRAGSGPWDIMDRGSFNGPGGPHDRWQVPALKGGAMPSGVMLRQRMKFQFLEPSNVLHLSREGLAKSGLVVAEVIARAAEPGPDGLAGIVVHLDGEPVPLAGTDVSGATTQDRTPWVDPATDPLSPGIPDYSYYTLEVVQRVGMDSFCPDSGVLLAKNKDWASLTGGPNQFLMFTWVIDAHPEDMDRLDFVRPHGEPVMRSIADYRQLNDALFHAGLDSGSLYEWQDAPNRLHFYVIDARKDAAGNLRYSLGVRSLDGSGPQLRGLGVVASGPVHVRSPNTSCSFELLNTGAAAPTDPLLHGQDTNTCLASDLYRISVTVDEPGWTVQLQNALVAVPFGGAKNIAVAVTRGRGASSSARVILTASSESDPGKKVTATRTVFGP